MCVSTPLSRPVPHATRFSLPVFPLRSVESFFFSLYVFTVAALSSAGSIIGSFHRCTHARVRPSLSLLNVNLSHGNFAQVSQGYLALHFLGCADDDRGGTKGCRRRRASLFRVVAADDSFHETKRRLAVRGSRGRTAQVTLHRALGHRVARRWC